MEEPIVFKVVPNIPCALSDNPLNKEIEANSARVLITDQNAFGIILPATIDSESRIATFVLPEQLCIFNPDQTYILVLEVETDTSGFLPFASHPAQIVLNGFLEAPEQQDGSMDVPTPPPAKKPPGPLNVEVPEDAELDAVLNAVAPLREQQLKQKIELKDIADEIIKQAIWSPPPVLAEQQKPLPPPESPERAALKLKVKRMLRGMLGG